ncbi:hypothetical protein TNCV_3811671 [Trichonephila clavipes]|nr:hypothetical protein TNCV_3811671 [Trichonephila clavipes]
MEVAVVFSFGRHRKLSSRTDLHLRRRVQSTGPVIVTRFFFHMCVFRGAMGRGFTFHGRQCTMSSHGNCKHSSLKWDIERMDWPARSPDLELHRSMYGFFSRRSLEARALPPVTIRELRWCCRRMGSLCLSNSLTPSFSAWAKTL